MLRIVTVMLMVVCGICLGAPESNYIYARAAAAKLKGEEALTAFIALADRPFSAAQKADALEQASALAFEQKKYDQAMELAKKIPIPSISKAAQIRILAGRGEWDSLLAQYKDEKIDDWWPNYLNGEAYSCRGSAYAIKGDGTNAAADLRKAADLTCYDGNGQGLLLIRLGNVYRDLLKDDTRALAAYREAYQTWNLYKRLAAAIEASGILARQNKLDEALAELKTIELDKVTYPDWRGRLLAAYASILAKQGQKAEAIARYREAAGLKDMDASQKTAYEKILRDLESETAVK